MERKPYPSDLTDEQWATLEPLIPPAYPGGRPRKTDLREVANALFYHAREGCSWRALPHDFGIPWKTVYNYFQWWTWDGTWQTILDTLRARVRVKAGRQPTPRVACIDSQSVKTAQGGQQVGTDGGKKVRGRKRHILVDTMGLLLAVVVTAANVDDAKAARQVFAQVPGKDWPRLEVVQADNKYHSPELDRWLRVHQRPYEVVVISREAGERRFVPLASRWVVERTFAWLLNYRRHRCDYAVLTATSEAMVQLSMIHLLLKRLA